ncbi:MAG: biotin--[acetyl-CoA-carboxylase] ligase [Acidobacteriota bacterium]|nr:MAG: biotin--[acetyl-CoA-carboxylase] ligase [Acidobacteriota bacterium]
MNITQINYDVTDSTNSEAVRQAKLGAAEGVCIVARGQTAGRGRQGRSWISEKDSGLYFSIILRPKLDPQFLPLITLMAGVAVHDALVEIGLKPDVKWVNDVHNKGKKISGILAETTDTPTGTAVIVGIGINVRSGNFPPELEDIATSIEDEGFVTTPGEVAAVLTKYLSYFYEILVSHDGPAAIRDEWSKRSSYHSGKMVRAVSNGDTIEGTTDGIEANGALRVIDENGALHVIQAGDVELLRTT